MFLGLFIQADILFCVQEFIRICESNVLDTVSWTLYINWYIKWFPMAVRLSTTSLSCPGALIPQSNIIYWPWDKTDMRYSYVAHIYCSAQPSVFSHIVLNVDVSNCFNSSIKSFLCAVVVTESCFLSSDKKKKHCM